MKKITFIKNGEIIKGFILDRDEDPRAAIQVIDATDCDVEYWVFADAVVSIED